MSQSVSGFDHSMCTVMRPLSTPSAGPFTVKGIASNGGSGG